MEKHFCMGLERKCLIVLACLFVCVPVSAMAGMMMEVSDLDLEDVSGQAGITLSMTTTVTAGSIAWGDSDGYMGTYTSQGWVVMSNVSSPQVILSNVTIDAGGNGTNAFLCINAGTTNVINGNMTIGALIIGTTSNLSAPTAGTIIMTGLGVQIGAAQIGAH